MLYLLICSFDFHQHNLACQLSGYGSLLRQETHKQLIDVGETLCYVVVGGPPSGAQSIVLYDFALSI